MALHEKEILTQIGRNRRIRMFMRRRNHNVVFFAVTLEYELDDGNWCAIARYDTAGGEPHRDRFYPNGDYLSHRETVHLGTDLNEAMKHARLDLITRSEWYVAEFLKCLNEYPV